MTAIHALMNGLIDYAGLFPPAKLDMQAAVENYAAYGSGGDAWALGRFIAPASGLAGFETAARPLGLRHPLSVLVSGDVAVDLRAVEEFRAKGIVIEAIECKAPDMGDVIAQLPKEVTAYVEVPMTDELTDVVAALASLDARAKIRAGGLTADAFPSARDVLKFLRCCVRHNVAFKATAGLHHPLRSSRPFTDEAENASGVMHGFINLFLAAALAYLGADAVEVLATLEEPSAAAFHFDATDVRWHGNRIATEDLSRVRQRFAISFGSCSFTEPLEDLKALGWL